MVAILDAIGWTAIILAFFYVFSHTADAIFYSLTLLSCICWMFVDAAHRSVIGVVIWVLLSCYLLHRIFWAVSNKPRT